MNILIVDDVDDNADLLRRWLKRRKHDTLYAENGKIAVEMVLEHTPDLVLMDVSMPIMSGLEATKIIRNSPEVANTPIIALTAHAMESDRQACLDAGCDAFATKPVDFALLNELIGEFNANSTNNERRTAS